MTAGWILLGSGVAVVAYAFAGYPALLALLAAARGGRGSDLEPRPGPDSEPAAGPPPRISITVPVYNEVHQIGATIESLLALEYPPERRQILIVSDGSDDGTDDVVRAYADRGVELLRVEQRGGKGAAENAARSHLTGDVVVNTDASIRIRPDALLPLVAPFADPSVGVVSGRDVSTGRDEGDRNTGEAGYVGYEMWVRDLETRTGGIVGASGCLYATRRELHAVPVPPELARDFSSALIAHEHGFRSVSSPRAICEVPRTPSPSREYRRKVRTVVRGLSTLAARRHLLNPFRHGAFAWKLFSHKLCRWLVPWALVAGAVGLALLAGAHPWALGLLAAGAVVAALGTFGWLWPEGWPMPRLVAAPGYFLMSNVAVLRAWLRALTRPSEAVWEPTRRDPAPPDRAASRAPTRPPSGRG